MTLTRSRKFLVDTVHNTYAWLKALDGKPQGIKISVPLYHDTYSDSFRERIHTTLTEKRVIYATVERPADEPNNWRLTDIHDTETKL